MSVVSFASGKYFISFYQHSDYSCHLQLVLTFSCRQAYCVCLHFPMCFNSAWLQNFSLLQFVTQYRCWHITLAKFLWHCETVQKLTPSRNSIILRKTKELLNAQCTILISSCTLIGNEFSAIHFHHSLFMFTCRPQKSPLEVRERKTAILLKRSSLSAGCHLIALGFDDAGTAFPISAELCKPFLVDIATLVPRGSITHSGEWDPESRKPTRVMRSTGSLPLKLCW